MTLSRCSLDIVANVLHCGIIVSDFILQLFYYVHFQTNTLEKDMNSLSILYYWLNLTIAVLQRYFWH